jgi:monoamine oxidase
MSTEFTTDEQCDVVVLGGGMAGLMAATQLKESNVVLLEAADRIGGRVESIRRGDYWVNVGAQFAEGEGPFIEAMNRHNVPRGSLVGKSAAFAINGKVISSHSPASFVLRSRLPLLARVDLALLGLRLLRAYKKLAANKNRSQAKEYKDWLDSQPASVMASQVRTDEVRAIFRAWCQHWIGCEPEETAATQFVLYMGSAMIKASEVPNFSLPVGGNQVLTDALASELGDRVRLGSRVTAVTWNEDQVEVEYQDSTGPRRIIARKAVVALTADQAVEVLKDLDDTRREALASIKYGRYVLAGIFTNEVGPQPWDDLYAIATPDCAFQVVYNHAAALRDEGPRKPGGALVCYAGGDPARELWSASDEVIREVYKRDFNRLFPGFDRHIEEMIIRRVERVVPFWGPGDRAAMRLLREPLGPISFAGDFMGTPSMTAAALAGAEAANQARSAVR